MKVVFVLCCCASFLRHISCSAIPMWEFLSKQEKTSYLYSMFANQVDTFCDDTNTKNCNQDLLKYGLKKLKTMSEDHLDLMDPYQRDANKIIWDSMMEGHAMKSVSPKPRKTKTTTAKPNSYEDHSFGEDFGSEEAGSAKIETVYNAPLPKNFIFKIESGKPLYTYPYNFQNIPAASKLHTEADLSEFSYDNQYSRIPLTGPMIVKMYPDGTPVKNSQQKLPEDEDLRQYQLSKLRVTDFP